MKLKNGDIYVCKEPIERLLAREDIPARYNLQLVKLAKKLREEIHSIDQVKDSLIKKYGEQDVSNPNKYTIDDTMGNWGKFTQEFNELMDVDTEIVTGKCKIPADICPKGEDLLALERFLELDAHLQE